MQIKGNVVKELERDYIEKFLAGICPECGEILEEIKTRSSIILNCPKCDFSVARSWSPFDEYPSRYKISVVMPENISSSSHYMEMSRFTGLNYLQLKKVAAGEVFTKEFDILNTWNTIKILNQQGIEHTVEPNFPFSSWEEMKEKLMLDE